MKKLKFNLILLTTILILSLSLVPISSNQAQIALVANSIDIEMNPSVIDSLKDNNLTFDYFETNSKDYSGYDYIIVIGGPDALGSGELSKTLLSDDDQTSLRTRRYRLMYETADTFRNNQKVFVIAGSDREFTKLAVDRYFPQIISQIKDARIEMPTSRNLSSSDLRQLIDSGIDLYLIDVRTSAEFSRGHLPGAVNIPQNRIRSRLNEVPRDKIVVLYCDIGSRAASSILIFDNNDFDNVYVLRDSYSTFFHRN